MKTKKTEYVFALAALLECLIFSSAQAGSLQGSFESEAVDTQSAVDRNVAPLYNIPSPSEYIGVHTPTNPDENVPSVRSPSELIGVQTPTNPDENVPLIIKLPTGGVALPSGKVIGIQTPTNLTQVTTENEP